MPHRRLLLGFLFGVVVIVDIAAFSPVSKLSDPAPSTFSNVSPSCKIRRNSNVNGNHIRIIPTLTKSSTSLNSLLEVPPYFFTFTFSMLGVLLSISKGFSRLRLEESAWEQRLEGGRLNRLRDDPYLTELELRRQEAEVEWSAYGKPRQQQKERDKAIREEDERLFRNSHQRVKVTEKDEDCDDNYDDDVDSRKHHMSDGEINQFEIEYGVEYDPYYDDPYVEEELPEGSFKIDKKYGDRIYENGEIFYKDKASNLFYRQGSKPRNLSFW